MDTTIDYDAVILPACPNYFIGIENAASLVLPTARELVSLGTGTGNLEAAILDKIPEVKIRGYEWNQNYLGRARQKLLRRFLGVQADITKIELPASDGVISSLTLHHITDEDKSNVFQKVYNSLSVRGRFINYDITKAESDEEHRDFVDYITAHMKNNGFSQDFIEEERRILHGFGEGADIPMTLSRQQKMLEETGFKFTLDWKDHLFVVYHCDKE